MGLITAIPDVNLTQTTKGPQDVAPFDITVTDTSVTQLNESQGNQTEGAADEGQTECEPASFERDEDGTISFERGAVEFESTTDETELSRQGLPFIDLEVGESMLDLSIETADESLEVDITESETDIEGHGTGVSLEQKNDEVEYVSEDIDLEWSPTKLDIDQPVIIDFRNNEFEYRDSTLAFEWDAESQQFEYDCRRR